MKTLSPRLCGFRARYSAVHSMFFLRTCFFIVPKQNLKGTVIKIEKTLLNDRLRVLKVS